MMARMLLAIGLGVSLSGCFLPTPVSMVSTGVDVVSYIATGKAATDHGLSYAMGEDCALMRLFKGEICREPRIYEPVQAGVPLEPLPAEADKEQLAAAHPEVRAAVQRASAYEGWRDDGEVRWTADWASSRVQVALLPGGFMADDFDSLTAAASPQPERAPEGLTFASILASLAEGLNPDQEPSIHRNSGADIGR